MEQVSIRDTIDYYTRVAQLSSLFPILLLAVWAHGETLQSKFDLIHATRKTALRSTNPRPAGSALRVWFRIQWWLGSSVFSNYGTRIEWLFGISWASWLAFLAVKDIDSDYLHFTKRLGAVGISQLPLCLLLAMKTKLSPLQIILQLSEQHLNTYHRVLARIIVGFISCHVLLYMGFFIFQSLISKRIFDTDVIMGITAFLALIAICITSLAAMRFRNYRLFFATHVLVGGLLLPLLYFHSRHLRLFLAESLAIYTINALTRYFNTQQLLANITCTPSAHVLVSIYLPDAAREAAEYPAATHVYLGIPRQSRWLPGIVRQIFIKNPFTIANSPSSKALNLLIRPQNGPTAHFRSLDISGYSAHSIDSMVPVVIEGPYGLSATFRPSFADHLRSRYDNVFFCAGGLGATFILPIVMAMLRSSAASSVSPFCPRIEVLLIVRTQVEADTILALFDDGDVKCQSSERAEASRSLRRLRDVLQIFLTNPGYDIDEVGDNDESFELANLVSEDHMLPSAPQESNGPGRQPIFGRPVWKEVLEQFFKYSSIHEKTAILTCGPDGMRTQFRDTVDSFVQGGRIVWWCEEKFGR